MSPATPSNRTAPKDLCYDLMVALAQYADDPSFLVECYTHLVGSTMLTLASTDAALEVASCCLARRVKGEEEGLREGKGEEGAMVMRGGGSCRDSGGTSGGKSGGNVPDGDDASGDDDNDDGRWLDAAKGIEYWEGAETSNQSSTSEKQPRRRNTKRRRVWDSFLYEVPRTPMFSAAQERSMGGLRGALGASMEARTVLEQQAAAANPRGGHASSSSSSSSSSTTPHQRSNEQRLREICVAMLQKQLPANAQRDQTKVRTTEDLAYTIAAAAVSAKQAGGMAGAEVRMESVRDDSARCFVSSLYIVMCVTNDANDG